MNHVIDIDKMDAEIEEELKTNVKLAIQTDLLKSLVNKVERSVAKKAVQDIYRFIYMDIKDEKLTLRAMNNDFTTEAFAEQNEKQTNFKITEGSAGSICFPADKFVPIIKRLNAKNTEINISSELAHIKSGRSSFDLHVLDGSEFPRIPGLGESLASVSIHPGLLANLYNQTMYAVSTREVRPILTGAYHVVNDKQLKCIATDSYRLAQHVCDLDESHNHVEVTVPGPVLVEAKKHLDAAEEEMNIYFYDNQIVYVFEGVVLYGRLLDGAYPNVERLIFESEHAASSFVVQAGPFKSLLNNSTVYNPDQAIIIRVKPEDGQLRVNTQEAEVGAFQEDLLITNGSGEDLVMGVNVRYLQEAFSRYNQDDYIKFEFMPPTEEFQSGLRPFKAYLFHGDDSCLDLFVPVRSHEVDYNAEVVIDDFEGVAEFEFNPFDSDFKELE